jgi:hypothetical protein
MTEYFPRVLAALLALNLVNLLWLSTLSSAVG